MSTLTINANTIFSLNGSTLAFVANTAVQNNGTFRLRGNETLTNVINLDTDSGTVEYVGNADAAEDAITIKDFGATDYSTLHINDTNSTKDLFSPGAPLTFTGFVLNQGTFTAYTQPMTGGV